MSNFQDKIEQVKKLLDFSKAFDEKEKAAIKEKLPDLSSEQLDKLINIFNAEIVVLDFADEVRNNNLSFIKEESERLKMKLDEEYRKALGTLSEDVEKKDSEKADKLLSDNL